jgi:hypothetical protein
MFSSKILMNSFGSSFKYFSNFSHKFGDAATVEKSSQALSAQMSSTNHGY